MEKDDEKKADGEEKEDIPQIVPATAPVMWRAWHINARWIITHDSMTFPGEPWEAICTNYGRYRNNDYHDAPDRDCTCGFYLLPTQGRIKKYIPPNHLNFGQVYSETYYWGRVIQHGNTDAAGNWIGDNIRGGVRAQYVYPARIYVETELVRDYPRLIEVIEKYGIPWVVDDAMYHVPTSEDLLKMDLANLVLDEKGKRKVRAQIRRYKHKLETTVVGGRSHKEAEKMLAIWTQRKTW